MRHAKLLPQLVLVALDQEFEDDVQRRKASSVGRNNRPSHSSRFVRVSLSMI